MQNVNAKTNPAFNRAEQNKYIIKILRVSCYIQVRSPINFSDLGEIV